MNFSFLMGFVKGCSWPLESSEQTNGTLRCSVLSQYLVDRCLLQLVRAAAGYDNHATSLNAQAESCRVVEVIMDVEADLPDLDSIYQVLLCFTSAGRIHCPCCLRLGLALD